MATKNTVLTVPALRLYTHREKGGVYLTICRYKDSTEWEKHQRVVKKVFFIKLNNLSLWGRDLEDFSKNFRCRRSNKQ